MHAYFREKARKNVKVYPTALLVGIGDNNEAEKAAAEKGLKHFGFVAFFAVTPSQFFTDSCRNFGGLLKS